ncbi:hypothetical protein TWF694_007412 [Orbilia ellipsospora]|uniref:Uncharacterized protein n=1 Tax=Orbilia ellipsospora TaxID=2528407 RepID=A0AAV9XL22_9PEZI
MIGFTKTAISLTAVLSLFAGALAAPAEKDYASLIETGPGMPTVAELGLTNKDLTKPFPKSALAARDALEKRYTPSCWGPPKCSYGDALACYNYLNSLGTRDCQVTGSIQMCKMGHCAWDARTLNGGFATSHCSDAAKGGHWVLDNCTNGGQTAGSNAAFNNGNLVVDVIGRK